MSTLADRLKQARNDKRLTQQQLAEKAGLSQPSYYKLESGKTLRTSYINALADALKVDARWLETGEEPKGANIENATDDYIKLNSFSSKLMQNIAAVPVVNIRYLEDYLNGKNPEELRVLFKENDVDEESMFFVRLSDDSMTPLYNNNDMLLIDRNKKPMEGDDVVAIVNGIPVFRRYKFDSEGNEQLIALNDFYSTYSDFELIGVAVEQVRKITE